MYRRLLPVLMISLLLTACGGSAAQREIEAQRDAYAAASELKCTAKLRVSVGETLFSCTLDCICGPEETRVTVIEPELIAGVSAVLRAGETALEYDGVHLSVGDPDGRSLPPLSCAPLLLQALKSAHVVRAWREKDGERMLYAAQLYASDDWELTVWYDAASLMPVHGEFSRDGDLIAACEIDNFSFR